MILNILQYSMFCVFDSTGLEYLVSAGNRLSRRDLRNAAKNTKVLYEEFWVRLFEEFHYVRTSLKFYEFIDDNFDCNTYYSCTVTSI